MPIIRRCIRCGSTSTVKTTRDGVVRVLCSDCDSEFEVEFDRLQIDHRWTLPESVLVLAALAIAASRAAAPYASR